MENQTLVSSEIVRIADAVREKSASQERMTIGGMADAVRNLKSQSATKHAEFFSSSTLTPRNVYYGTTFTFAKPITTSTSRLMYFVHVMNEQRTQTLDILSAYKKNGSNVFYIQFGGNNKYVQQFIVTFNETKLEIRFYTSDYGPSKAYYDVYAIVADYGEDFQTD